MWLNYVALFVCAGAALYQFGMAIKHNSIMFATFGILSAGLAGLNYYLL